MLSRTSVLLLACLLPAGCDMPGQPFVADTARLQPGMLGNFEDPDVAAVNQAQWAFADSGRTYGRPIEAARAAAGMDYIAGQLNTSPRWSRISAITKMQLLQGRDEVRRALGVAPGAPSQAVVNGLAGAGNALADNNQPAALAALSSPVFTRGADATLRQLANLPYMQMANVSTMHAANELFDSSTNDRF